MQENRNHSETVLQTSNETHNFENKKGGDNPFNLLLKIMGKIDEQNEQLKNQLRNHIIDTFIAFISERHVMESFVEHVLGINDDNLLPIALQIKKITELYKKSQEKGGGE